VQIPEHIARRVEALRKALKDPDEQVRVAASKSLEKLEAVGDLDVLVARFKDGDHVERIRVIYAFGKIRSEVAVKALMYALRSDNVEVRTAAIRALGDSKDVRGLDALLELLPGTDETSQVEIIGVLPGFSDPRVIPAIQAQLKNRSLEVVDAAVQAMGRIGKAELEGPLLLALEKGPVRLRRSAAAALGDLEL